MRCFFFVLPGTKKVKLFIYGYFLYQRSWLRILPAPRTLCPDDRNYNMDKWKYLHVA